MIYFFFQAEDGIRDPLVTGVQTCALPISHAAAAQIRAVAAAMQPVQNLEDVFRNAAPRDRMLAAIDDDGVSRHRDFCLGLVGWCFRLFAHGLKPLVAPSVSASG